jgi:hypothetical protein
MQFRGLNSQEFRQLKAEIESYSRLCGYYLIDLVALPEVLGNEVEHDSFLDKVFQHFDDQEWPPPNERPTDQMWADYTQDRDSATNHVIEALVGGSSIGHTSVTIPPKKALELWCRFESLFSPSRRYYIGMGLGNSQYVFLYGAAIVDEHQAGLLWIVEND